MKLIEYFFLWAKNFTQQFKRNKYMLNRLIALVLLIHLALTSIIFFLIALLIWLFTVPFDKKRRVLHKFTCFWGSYYTYTFPAWTVKVEGREKIDKNDTYVYISNHQSLLDILVYFRLYSHFKWVSKEEVFKLPFIGWNMSLNQYVALKRGYRSSLVKMMKDCMKHLAKGNSVFIFPEGTRSEDGSIKGFQKGAFVLAKNSKVSILPMVIHGTANALPKKSLKFHGRHNITVKVLDPIPYREIADMDEDELADKTRDQIVREFEKMES